MKHDKLPSTNRVRSSELVRCVEYLEAHGGRLTQSWTRTKWPDGTVTDFAWQYAADDTGVLGAKTAIGAIKQHMVAGKRQAPNAKVQTAEPPTHDKP